MNKEEIFKAFKDSLESENPIVGFSRHKVKSNQLSKVLMQLIDIYLKEGDLEVVNLQSICIGKTQVKDLLGRIEIKYGVIVREMK